MPPALETIDLDSDPEEPGQALLAFKQPSKNVRQSLVPVIHRSGIRQSSAPAVAAARQYPDGPLPLRPSADAPRKAHIIGRVADDDGVSYSLMLGQVPIDGVGMDEILDFVSAYDLEEYENAQFVEEEENRQIAKAAEEADKEAKRLRQLERIRKKGIVYFEEQNEDPESNEEGEVALGRHGRARPTYTHLYKLPGGGKHGGVRRRRKRDPSTGELMPLSDEEDGQAMGSSDDETDLRRAAARSDASQSLASGLQLPKRRRRKRHPVTGVLMPLSDDDNAGSSHGDLALRQSTRSSSAVTLEPPARSSAIQAKAPSARSSSTSTGESSARPSSIREMEPSTRSSPARRSSPTRRPPPNVAVEVQKRRRRRRDPRTGELLPLDSDPMRDAAMNTPSTEERKKRPRRRRHPVTGELMPLGWVYNPDADRGSPKAKAAVPSIQRLSITPRDSKRVKLTSEPSSQEDDQQPPAASTSAVSPNVRRTQVVELESSDSSDQEDSDQKHSPSLQLTIFDAAPVRAPTQVRSPKHGMMQRAMSSNSSDNEPITLASFLSTTATGKALEDEDDSSDDSSSDEIEVHNKTAPQKTSMMNPMASQEGNGNDESSQNDEDEYDELGEGEYFVEGIAAHHLSDPFTHPGKPRTMLYHTKWEGYSELTWEPAASFPDQSVVEEYRKRVGLK